MNDVGIADETNLRLLWVIKVQSTQMESVCDRTLNQFSLPHPGESIT